MNGFGVIKTLFTGVYWNIEYVSIHFKNLFLEFAGLIVEQTFLKARSAVYWCSLSGVKTYVFVQSTLERGIAESPPNLHCYSCQAPFTSSGDSILTFKVGFMFYS